MSRKAWFVLGWTGPMMAIHPAPARPFEVVPEGHPDLEEARGKHGDWAIESGPFDKKSLAEADASERRRIEEAKG